MLTWNQNLGSSVIFLGFCLTGPAVLPQKLDGVQPQVKSAMQTPLQTRPEPSTDAR